MTTRVILSGVLLTHDRGLEWFSVVKVTAAKSKGCAASKIFCCNSSKSTGERQRIGHYPYAQG
ncbi:MAG: hypothetical protein NT070_18465 [Cyanobacteria bacterium]|nr:hypothetical protein [Cyanobacteriota bacterium]